jgi:hypothetical protein
VTWKGDHGPRHVHVFRDGRLVVKWDLEQERVMKGSMSAEVMKRIRELQAEGRL